MLNLFPKKLPAEKYLNYEDVCYYRYTKNPCPKMCVGKKIVDFDNIRLIPKNSKKNMSKRLSLTKKLKTRKNISGSTVVT